MRCIAVISFGAIPGHSAGWAAAAGAPIQHSAVALETPRDLLFVIVDRPPCRRRLTLAGKTVNFIMNGENIMDRPRLVTLMSIPHAAMLQHRSVILREPTLVRGLGAA
jgi:hypothetical protein